MGHSIENQTGVVARSLGPVRDTPITRSHRPTTDRARPNQCPCCLQRWLRFSCWPILGKGHQLCSISAALAVISSLLVTVHRAEPVRLCQQPCVLFPELLHGILLEHSEHDLTTRPARHRFPQKRKPPRNSGRLSISVQSTWRLTACWSDQQRSSREHRPAEQQLRSCL